MRRVASPAAAVSLVFVCLAVLAATPTSSSLAADALVPPAVQAVLTVRILEYDRALKKWAGGNTLLVGVVSKQKDGAMEFRRALEGRSVQGLAIQTSEHIYQDPASFNRWILYDNIRLVYLAADLDRDAKGAITATMTRKVCSITVTEDQFQFGGTLGIVLQGGRPRILVHADRSKAVGMDLDPKLLQLAGR